MPVTAGVIRAGERQTRRGAAETFTGVVFQDPVITANSPSRMGGSVVTFTPGARTAWHAHPVGQTLFCLSGVGRICFEGEQPQVLNPGDTVNIPPNTMHWHGALARSAVLSPGAVGSRREGRGHRLGPARQR
jgi:quercetin dioxygenase-like cupin family protein